MKFGIISIIVSSVIVSGCAVGPKPYSGVVYNGPQAQRAQQTSSGTIIAIRQITIQDNPNITGASVGIGMGALAFLGFVGTSANPYGVAAGAIAAGVLGGTVSDYVAKKVLEQPGFEFTIRMKDGKIITVVQTNIDMMATGDQVLLTQSADGTLRVYKP